MSASKGHQPYRILAYGIETKGLEALNSTIVSEKYKLEFANRIGAPRFQQYDGVIVFQGMFETFKPPLPNGYIHHSWDRDELDKRTKEVQALIEKGGFVCLLLTDPFIDFHEHVDVSATDLAKRLLADVRWNNFGDRTPILASKVDALRKFLDLFGAASSSFSLVYGTDASVTTLASADGYAVSVAINGRIFAIPTLVPERNYNAVEEFFTTLADGVVALWEQFREDLPAWAAEYHFAAEAPLVETKVRLSNKLSEIDHQLMAFERLKRVLVLQGEPLVDAVIEVFDKALPLKPKREEAFREDLVLLDSSGNAVAFAEVKGVSRGVAREHVNQADSHRERNEKPPAFPSLLIINTHMKSSASIADKDQKVPAEQIQHAARNKILILRTLDLLNLASLHLNGKLGSEAVVDLLTKSCGWLRVSDVAEVLSS